MKENILEVLLIVVLMNQWFCESWHYNLLRIQLLFFSQL